MLVLLSLGCRVGARGRLYELVELRDLVTSNTAYHQHASDLPLATDPQDALTYAVVDVGELRGSNLALDESLKFDCGRLEFIWMMDISEVFR
jgi:hypothetical protein